MNAENEMVADIVAEMMSRDNLDGGDMVDNFSLDAAFGEYGGYDGLELIKAYANRIDAAEKGEALSIERIVRDAIIGYNGLYVSAPNDDAERELKERAARGNAWLVAHGFEEEKVIWSKEETSCL